MYWSDSKKDYIFRISVSKVKAKLSPSLSLLTYDISKKDTAQHDAVMPAIHFPLSNNGERSMAKAERNARVTKVSAIPPLQTTEPLDLHKQEEWEA